MHRTPHVGYAPGEHPTYRLCGCGQHVRIDRLDLLAEHREACTSPVGLVPGVRLAGHEPEHSPWRAAV